MNNCKAYRENDMMVCGQCGLQWSIGDSDRPDCKPVEPTPKKIRRIRSWRRIHNLRGVK